MGPSHRAALVATLSTLSTLSVLAGTAGADPVVPDLAPGTTPATAPVPGTDAGPAPAPPPAEAGPKQPKRGDFDAGGQVRLPSGPDEMGQFATFNWIALDLKGQYVVLDPVVIKATVPLAVKKPDTLMTGEDPSMIGGATVTLEARLPKPPFVPRKYSDTEVALVVTGAYMREGAMLLSDKDYPRFVGDFQPGFTAGTVATIKLSSLLDFATAPVFVYQAGTTEAATAVQIPTSTIVKLGSLLKVSADLGVFTGDDFSFRGSNGGRIAAGGAIDIKLGPIVAHAGAGAASLLTGGAYPTISDSFYVDLNVKYAK
ncbi:MAG TPA: hypothetical protein VM734_28925 [Kofleriaceae bacterium]|jgi:hypothetical protein|nr:hypothetical protein [Kofleriaceae bacterium]